MKWIVAMIPPERLDAVQAALEQTDADLAYLGQVLDLRDQTPEMYRGVEYRAGRLKIRLEILVANDIQAEETIGVLATACAETQNRTEEGRSWCCLLRSGCRSAATSHGLLMRARRKGKQPEVLRLRPGRFWRNND